MENSFATQHVVNTQAQPFEAPPAYSAELGLSGQAVMVPQAAPLADKAPAYGTWVSGPTSKPGLRANFADWSDRKFHQAFPSHQGDRYLLHRFMEKSGYEPHAATKAIIRELDAGSQGLSLVGVAKENPQGIYDIQNALKDHDAKQASLPSSERRLLFAGGEGLAFRRNLNAACLELDAAKRDNRSPFQDVDFGQVERLGEKKKSFRTTFTFREKDDVHRDILENYLANHSLPVPKDAAKLLGLANGLNNPKFQAFTEKDLSSLKALEEGISGYNLSPKGRSNPIFGGFNGTVVNNLRGKIHQLDVQQQSALLKVDREKQAEQQKVQDAEKLEAQKPAALAKSYQEFMENVYLPKIADYSHHAAPQDALKKDAEKFGKALLEPFARGEGAQNQAKLQLSLQDRQLLAQSIADYQEYAPTKGDTKVQPLDPSRHFGQLDNYWKLSEAKERNAGLQAASPQASNTVQSSESQEMSFSAGAVLDENGNPLKNLRNPDELRKHNWPPYLDHCAADRINKTMHENRYDLHYDQEKKGVLHKRDGEDRFFDDGRKIQVFSNDETTVEDVVKRTMTRNTDLATRELHPLDFKSVNGDDKFKENVLKASAKLGFPVHNVPDHLKAKYEEMKKQAPPLPDERRGRTAQRSPSRTPATSPSR